MKPEHNKMIVDKRTKKAFTQKVLELFDKYLKTWKKTHMVPAGGLTLARRGQFRVETIQARYNGIKRTYFDAFGDLDFDCESQTVTDSKVEITSQVLADHDSICTSQNFRSEVSLDQ